VAVVEWADRVRNLMPERTLWLQIANDEHGGRAAVLTAAPGVFPWLADLPKIV
jgi:tRNA A37 threonylcarbamoyladenosine biosynthesis protein TsaE